MGQRVGGQRIAIIGSGISGLGAAWALHSRHDITVYEADDRIGGHSNTVDVVTPTGVTSVDTGFIVYNEVTYPNLTRLFSALEVPTEPSDMSFGYSLDRRFEYGASLRGAVAQPSNLVRPRFLAMLRDINRFRREGSSLRPNQDESIGELLERNGYSEGFREDYLFPMTGAIWSASRERISKFPAQPIMRFLSNHGLVEIVDRPTWRTVTGGSRSYVDRLTAGFRDRIHVRSAVNGVTRTGSNVEVHTARGSATYDEVVFATHTDQSLHILGSEATESERRLLKSISYQPNEAVLHSDQNLMPSRQAVWSSWNAMARTDIRQTATASISYWMNRLQNLDQTYPLFVSLNPIETPNPELTHARFEYSHPQFDRSAVDAQRGISEIQGLNNTWFAGAYMGYGFHEDGLQSGLNVAAALGSPAPWHGSFQPVSSAPTVMPNRVAIR